MENHKLENLFLCKWMVINLSNSRKCFIIPPSTSFPGKHLVVNMNMKL